MSKESVLICLNDGCLNTQIIRQKAFSSIVEFVCGSCGKPLIKIATTDKRITDSGPIMSKLRSTVEKTRLIENEELKKWPGPIATEYNRMVNTMQTGNTEAACWKLANLYDVIRLFFNAAAVDGNKDYRKKFLENEKFLMLNEIKSSFNNRHLSSLTDDSLESIRIWRNRVGIGHGTLTENKMALDEDVCSLFLILNGCLCDMNKILEKENLTCFKNLTKSFSGSDYYNRITFDDSGTFVMTREGNNISLGIKIMGFQFDSPDIYFIDRDSRKHIFYYRNFSNNRVKYITPGNREIRWSEDRGQVNWMDQDEYEKWLTFIRNEKGKNNLSIGAINLEEISNLLIFALEGFVVRGMFEQAEIIIRDFKEFLIKDKIVNVRMEIAEYDMKLFKAYTQDNLKYKDRVEATLRSIQNNKSFIFRIKLLLKESWHVNANGYGEKAIALCKEALEELKKGEVNSFDVRSLKLEVEKNLLYFERKFLLQSDKKKTQSVINEYLLSCSEFINEALILLEYDQKDYIIIDNIGFIANLYGQALFELLKIVRHRPDREIETAKNLQSVGEKLRKRALDSQRNNVWLIRGYAWSLHHKARMIIELDGRSGSDEITTRAVKLLEKAMDERIQGSEKFPKDSGLIEDLIRNYIDLIIFGEKVRVPNNILLQYRISAFNLLNEKIKGTEGESTRYNKLYKLLNDCKF